MMGCKGIFAIAVCAFFAGAQAVDPPIGGYQVFVPQWEVEAVPGGGKLILNGTVEQVRQELIALNPAYEQDFAAFDKSRAKGKGRRGNAMHQHQARTDWNASATSKASMDDL
ncbi:hypothetical protein CDD81_5048 [Ophiocordyceps australis]|uniref:Uncharacterized protein n=1 Tax=Ophiocordyceps australis TaxID=1399860 RepID=A0A2C5Y3I9_9HYPO|nr:hypothetical protein CDD81_5048 [Ophiocordyceps australis]